MIQNYIFRLIQNDMFLDKLIFGTFTHLDITERNEGYSFKKFIFASNQSMLMKQNSKFIKHWWHSFTNVLFILKMNNAPSSDKCNFLTDEREMDENIFGLLNVVSGIA